MVKRAPKGSHRASRLKREAKKRANKPFVLHPRLQKTGTTTLMDSRFMAPAELTALSRIRKEIVIRPSVMRVLDPASLRPSAGLDHASARHMVGKRVLLQGLRNRKLNGKEARIRRVLKDGKVQLTMLGQTLVTRPENLKELKTFVNTSVASARKTIAGIQTYDSTPYDAQLVHNREEKRRSQAARVSQNDFRFTNAAAARAKLSITYTVDSDEAATVKAERQFLHWQKEQLRQSHAEGSHD